MSQLVQCIKRKLEENGTSAYKLEKDLGLKRSAINNILYGRSRSPGIEIIQAIAHGLGCSIHELLGNNDVETTSLKHSELETNFLNLLSRPIDNPDLYFQAMEKFGNILRKKGVPFSKEKIFYCIEEIYNYSLKREDNKIDAYFIEWIIDRHTSDL